MPAGYVRVWLSIEEAIDHILRVAECRRQEARDALTFALRDGCIRSRFGDNGQEIKHFHWLHAADWAPRTSPNGRQIKIQGEAAWLRLFFDPPPDPEILPERPRQIEVQRDDLMRLWPMPLTSTDAGLITGTDRETTGEGRPASPKTADTASGFPADTVRARAETRLKAAMPEPAQPYVHKEWPKYLADPDGAVIVQSREEEDRQKAMWRRRSWRRDWIAKFAERQRIARRWIALIDLVDWCAQSTTAASDDEEAKARVVAYRRLVESMRRGEFERNGRSKLLYLDALVTSDGTSPRCRLTREQFEIEFDAAALPPAPSLPITVLNCCWLPADLARQWLEAHGYGSPPYLKPKAPQGTGPSDATLPMDDAIRRVGRGLYGGDWIGELTERERWLIEQYIDGPRKDRGSTILPGAISYMVGGRRWSEVPGDSALMAEADRARDRRDWMEAQCEAVFDWFESRGFDLDSDRIDKARFDVALAAPHKRGAADRQPAHKASEISGPQAEPAASVHAEAITHSGFPGRPGKAKHLIEDEFERRTKSDEALRNLADEAAALLDWLKEAHPIVPRPTKRTIENNIRGDHRRWKATSGEADPS